MRFPRSCGTLVHPTSFPSSYGMGDLGPQATQFIDILAETGQTIWQVLPLGPVGHGNSPYAGNSAFAGNPYLISPDILREKGLADAHDTEQAKIPVTTRADYHASYRAKDPLYRAAARRFFASMTPQQHSRFEAFKNANRSWLDDYCLFVVCSDVHDGRPWNRWEPAFARREPDAIRELRKTRADEIRYQEWLQYEFSEQWRGLKQYANSKNIRVIGDIPIFVDHNSADVWGNSRFFDVDELGNRIRVAGVPPDYFSSTGQLWGNPLYRWDVLEKENFSWWIDRFKQMFELYDAVRVDHFRGFEAYWEVSAEEETAVNGRWIKGPGHTLFDTLHDELGELPVIAEDLGVITPDVEKLRDDYGFPGMKVLQFAFNSDSSNGFLPHNYSNNCMVYTGTHDNDTTLGWYRSAPGIEQHRAREYTRSDGHEMHWELIRLAMLSVADQAVFPLQDFMNLDGRHRMNTPGTAENNWEWRYTPEMLASLDKGRIGYLVELSNRKAGYDSSETAARKRTF